MVKLTSAESKLLPKFIPELIFRIARIYFLPLNDCCFLHCLRYAEFTKGFMCYDFISFFILKVADCLWMPSDESFSRSFSIEIYVSSRPCFFRKNFVFRSFIHGCSHASSQFMRLVGSFMRHFCRKSNPWSERFYFSSSVNTASWCRIFFCNYDLRSE